MAEDKDITVPSAGNKKLQPDILALGKTRDFKNADSDLRSGDIKPALGKTRDFSDPQYDLRSGKFDTSLTPFHSSFRRGSDGLLRLKGEQESFVRGKDGLLRPTVSPAPTPKRDVVGDGPKSTLRPSEKNFSASSRPVPKSGYFPMRFRGGIYDNAVGGLANPVAINNFGLNPVGFMLGSTTLQAMSWSGGQPLINIVPNGTAATTTFHQAEHEGIA